MSTIQPVPSPFMDTLTFRNLRGACLDEMHARRLYLQCARRMEEAALHVVAHAFHFTAAQEKEHADVFRGLLTVHSGCSLPMAEDTPLLLPHTPLEILQTVIQSETTARYSHYAQTASEEGYHRIANAFRRIAETEQLHLRRFRQYMKVLQEGSLFRDEAQVSWFCLPCGQLHSGREAPESCSGCGRDRGHFIRSSYYPFAVREG